ncbi:hypothetical protein TWF569_000663 [Orbilia oligospora]|uniref:U-box domain-containing protein n=2 Tax=Orbilia oligospora TaxID=2813651 RepID=A0A7C8K4X1_ORBOL|nr:hypothetical protein TWF102_000988 [Orbilia oligospora]KAF3083039.1 hypothetical protein TWF102_000988 [Orbilia oligospora]KAF3087339.1 hypothetical protein TWF706_011200 [Orbilia oligospora]KAF3110327.1 hypothetical protein TWF103_004619 [Orbilia oligospora]KAF3124572.1 hypothetical protein TWF594_001835 [Orbilia oligospora]
MPPSIIEMSAEELKQAGNKFFQNGDWLSADKKYSQAIAIDSTNYTLFTNRALVRMKLLRYDDVIDDCTSAINLNRDAMKGYYMAAQALIQLSRPSEALGYAHTAYQLAVAQNSKSATDVANVVLEAKKQRWKKQERNRIDRDNSMLKQMKELVKRDSERKILDLREQQWDSPSGDRDLESEIAVIREDARVQMDELENVFARADPQRYKPREVPDYLMDSISFSIMTDPVVTKNGHSYDRPVIMDHLRRSNTDPLTREPLSVSDLRPNLALKQVCAEFLEENAGWAVDY